MTNDRRFAERTKVTVEKSVEDAKRLLRRYGATHFAQMEGPDFIQLAFVVDVGDAEKSQERRIRFTVPMPQTEDMLVSKKGVSRSESGARTARDKEIQRLWRALLAGIKGKLIMVDDGIESIEQAFYANVVLPNGNTIAEEIGDTVKAAYERGLMPPTMLALPEGKSG